MEQNNYFNLKQKKFHILLLLLHVYCYVMKQGHFFFFGSDDLIVLVSVSTGCSFSSTKQIVLRLLTQIWLCTRQHWIWPWPWSLSPLVTVRPPRRVGAYCLSPPRLLSSAEISRSIRQRWLCLRKRTKSDTIHMYFCKNVLKERKA